MIHFYLHAQTKALNEKVSINLKNTTALQVIRELDRQSEYSFSYTQTQLDKITLEAFSYDSILLGKALDVLARRAGLAFSVSGSVIAIRVAAPVTETAAPPAQGKPGKVNGVVRNEKNDLMAGVTIKVEGSPKAVSTTVTGDYVLALSAGTYTLVVSFVGHQTKRITDVIVKENEVTDLGIVLTRSDAKQLEAVVVTSGARRESVRALLMTQKNNAAITDGISAEQIRVTPDNNTAQVLKRVSGITVTNNKFVTIRGVSDRYNNVLINGSTLPSTEPNRRNFSFDIVPSALVDNVVINKTATPDLPSEFTGGIVQINTKEVPAKNFLEITAGSGFNTASAGKDFMSFKRDEKAGWGKVDENRKWFGDGKVFDPVLYQQRANAANDTAYANSVGKAIPNRWQRYKYPYTPVRNYQLAGGINKSFENGHALGFVGAITYRNEQLYEEGPSRVLDQSDLNNQRYQYTNAIGALFNTAWKTPRHRIAWKNLYNNRYSNTFNIQAGQLTRYGSYVQRQSEVTLTNDLLQTRLEGEHAIGRIRLKLDWYGDYTRLIREQPDTRFLTGRGGTFSGDKTDSLYDVNTEQKDYDFQENTIIRTGLHSSRLEETRRNAGSNVTLPFTVFKEKQFFKTGYAWSERKVDFDASSLIVKQGFNGTTYLEEKQTAGAYYPFYEIVTPEAFARGDLKYMAAYPKAGTSGDRYTGKQTLRAGYAMLDLHLLQKLRLTGGMRYENNKINLSTVFYNQQGFSRFDDSSYHESDWLPSVNLTYSITNQINVRAAYSKTLARPDFVERSPYTYFDFTELANVIGKKSLQYSRIRNYDLRFEYYPSGTEILSGSLFYKEFENPVERFYNLGDVLNSIEYRNLYSATATGFEVDVRKSLSFISPSKSWLHNFYISGNFTYLKGGITYYVTQRSQATNKDTTFLADDDRPIQGLSPYIVNAGLLYQSKNWGFNVAYNRFGRRIINGGGIPDLVQYEHPRDIIDLQLTTRLMKQKMELRLNISDILNQYYIIYSNYSKDATQIDPKGKGLNENLDFVNYKVKRGANITFNVTYKL
jgi:TonB-dependent receptor